MKAFFFILFCLLNICVYAQVSDILLLKKKGRTEQTFTSGGHIRFTAKDGTFIDADIIRIQHDTLYMRSYTVKQVPTTLGVLIPDTAGTYPVQYNYNDIKSLPQTGRHFDVAASGASLMGGGILITVASGIVYLADRSKFSSGLLIAGISLGAIGYFLSKHHSDMIIGRKYQFSYLELSSEKK